MPPASLYQPTTSLAFAERPITVQYTNPSSSVTISAGQVVVVAGLPYIATADILPLALGTLAISGAVWSGQKSAGAWNFGDEIFWNATATSNLGATGAYQNAAAGGGVFVGIAIETPGTSLSALTGDNYGYFVKVITPGPSLSNVIADPGAAGAIPVTNSGVVNLVSAAAETRTLAAPAGPGISITLNADNVAAGTITVNSATTNVGSGSHQHIALSAAGQSIELRSIATSTANVYRWAVAYNDGTTIS